MVKQICYVILMAILFVACYEEDEIVPSVDDEELRFEFPQGDNSWDRDIVEISEKFGVHLIYKNFKHSDFNRSWTGVVGTEYFGEDLSDEQAELSTMFMKNHVFAHLTPELVAKVLPDYWYLVYDYHNSWELMPGMGFKVSHSFLPEGLDFWGTCLFYGDPCPISGDKIETPGTAEEFRQFRCEVLLYVFTQSFNVGNITLPLGWEERFDYKTPLLYSDADRDDENYYIARGFPVYTGSPTPVNEQFVDYLEICMFYTKQEFEEIWSPIKYPLINEMRQVVIEHIKNNYGVDLDAISALTEGW